MTAMKSTSVKKQTTRTLYDNLIPELSRSQTDAPSADLESEATTSDQLAKHKNPAYFRTTVYLPRALRSRLKIAAASKEKDVSDLIADVMAAWLDQQDSIKL